MSLSLSQNIGLESYCLRHFKDTPTVIQKLQKMGVRNLELCGCHIEFTDPDRFERDIQPYREAGISIVSLFLGSIEEEKSARIMCECARRAGVRHLAVSFSPGTSPASWHMAEKLGDEFDVLFAIHNHGGYDWLGSRQMLEHVFQQTGPRIGLCLDTAWAMAAGEDPMRMIEEFADRMYGVHVKDFIFDRAGKPEDVIVGTGNLDLAKLIPALERLPNLLTAVIEYEGEVEDPINSLTKCLEVIRNS